MNPLAARQAHSILSGKSKKVLQGLASKKHLSDAAVKNLTRNLRTEFNGHDLVHVVHQRANCTITIPAG